MTVINGDHLWVMAQGGGIELFGQKREGGVYAFAPRCGFTIFITLQTLSLSMRPLPLHASMRPSPSQCLITLQTLLRVAEREPKPDFRGAKVRLLENPRRAWPCTFSVARKERETSWGIRKRHELGI